MSNIDLSPIIGAVVTNILLPLILLAGTWLSAKAGSYFSSKDKLTKAEAAQQKILLLVQSMAGRAWVKLTPTLQRVFADGRVSLEERRELEATIRSLLVDFTSQDDLESLAKALNVPFAGLISMIAEKVLRIFIAAHDPDDETSTQPFQFAPGDAQPVAGEEVG